MENFFLNELINATQGEFMSGDPHAPVKSISIDTRTMTKDDYYIAIKGEKYDGYTFIKQAIDKKASGLILSFDVLKLDSSIQAFPTFPSIVKVRDTNRENKRLSILSRSRRREIRGGNQAGYQVPNSLHLPAVGPL